MFKYQMYFNEDYTQIVGGKGEILDAQNKVMYSGDYGSDLVYVNEWLHTIHEPTK